jgi:hypothetical protein
LFGRRGQSSPGTSAYAVPDAHPVTDPDTVTVAYSEQPVPEL